MADTPTEGRSSITNIFVSRFFFAFIFNKICNDIKINQMHLYNVVLFFILFYFNVAQIFLPLNPQIVVFMKNATSE